MKKYYFSFKMQSMDRGFVLRKVLMAKTYTLRTNQRLILETSRDKPNISEADE